MTTNGVTKSAGAAGVSCSAERATLEGSRELRLGDPAAADEQLAEEDSLARFGQAPLLRQRLLEGLWSDGSVLYQ